MSKEFLAQATIRAKAKSPIRSLLSDRDSPIAQAFRSARAALPSPETAAALTDQLLANLNIDPLRATAEAGRRGSGAVERLLVGDKKLGRAGVARTNIEDLLTATGAGIQVSVAQRAFDVGLADPRVTTARQVAKVEAGVLAGRIRFLQQGGIQPNEISSINALSERVQEIASEIGVTDRSEGDTGMRKLLDALPQRIGEAVSNAVNRRRPLVNQGAE